MRVRGKRDSERRKKKRKGNNTSLPNPVVETRWGKRQSWFTRRELRVGTRNCGFCRVPKGRVSPTLVISYLVAM